MHGRARTAAEPDATWNLLSAVCECRVPRGRSPWRSLCGSRDPAIGPCRMCELPGWSDGGLGVICSDEVCEATETF